MYFIVYQTTNLINNKYYVGRHITNNLNDKYLGSGKRLLQSIKKYGKENFEREILMFCNSHEELNEIERLVVDEIMVRDRNSYNIGVGGGSVSFPGNLNPMYGTKRFDTIKRNKKNGYKIKGKNNMNWNGTWITPLGEFDTSKEAAEAEGIKQTTLKARVNYKTFPQYYKNKG